MLASWQKRRSEFNHDWLKNEFIIALGKWINILDGKVEDKEFEHTFILFTLSSWESHKEEAVALPRDFENAMSPRKLFESPPLSSCDLETKVWLGALIHELWLERYGVKQLVKDTDASVEDTNTSYNNLQNAIRGFQGTEHTVALRPLKHMFLDFREQCMALAKTIERFPSEIKAL